MYDCTFAVKNEICPFIVHSCVLLCPWGRTKCNFRNVSCLQAQNRQTVDRYAIEIKLIPVNYWTHASLPTVS